MLGVAEAGGSCGATHWASGNSVDQHPVTDGACHNWFLRLAVLVVATIALLRLKEEAYRKPRSIDFTALAKLSCGGMAVELTQRFAEGSTVQVLAYEYPIGIEAHVDRMPSSPETELRESQPWCRVRRSILVE